MKAKGCEDYKVYTVEFVCCVLGLTCQIFAVCCLRSYFSVGSVKMPSDLCHDIEKKPFLEY